jgi:hypothetical protein
MSEDDGIYFVQIIGISTRSALTYGYQAVGNAPEGRNYDHDGLIAIFGNTLYVEDALNGTY